VTTAATRRRARRSSWRARLRRDDGATAIEFAIVAVAVLAIIFGAIQASMYYWARSVAVAAAQEGANAQRAYNASPGSGQAQANTFIANAGGALTNAHVTVAAGAQQVQVTVTGQCLSIVPGFCSHVPIRVTVNGTVERPTNP
jgi:Flp pilus assembly protein TadG